MSLAQRFVWFWKKAEIAPRNPDVIVSITYGTLPDRLANATVANMRTAVELANRFPRAQIAFANAGNCFPGSEHVERVKKAELLKKLGMKPVRYLEASEPIYSTVTECGVIRDALVKARVRPREITLVVEESHSRGAMYIWQHEFPDVRFSLVHIPFEYAYQPDHPISLQTGPWMWILANVLRQTALRTLGVDVIMKVVHHAKVRS